jgi:2-polyprenyl-3-methyl-5-hydroxy-6-metoxy-1,4-benzoquinol methylase
MLDVVSNRRLVIDEIMDSPDVGEARHLQALAGLRRINRFSRTSRQIALPIVQLARRAHLHQLSIMDVACGGGDVPIGVALELKRQNIQVDLTLVDRSATAVRQAASAAKAAGISVQAIESDLLAAPSLPSVDIVTNSLFLHHLKEPEQVVGLLRAMRGLARRMVVISDLVRSRRGYAAAWIGCRLLSCSEIVHHDGPASVRAAWTIGELADYASNAGMDKVRVHRGWPCRMMLIWEPA